MIAMVFPPNPEDNADLPDYGPRFDWSESTQGHVLGAYFYGSVVAHIPGGMLAEVVGPRIVVGVTSVLGSVLTCLCPPAAKAGAGWLIALRVIIGLCGGMLYPSLHALVAQWAPPQEKGKFVWCLLGGTFATVVTWPGQSFIIEHLGWEASFYIIGAVVFLWSLIWPATVFDSPDQHSRITPEEKNYIATSIAGTVTTEKRVLPFRSALTSCPYLALVVLHFGNLGGLFFLMTEGPKYMYEVLGFDLKESGFFASLPYLMRLIFGIFFSGLGDWCLSNPDRSRTLVRKLFVISSHIMPAVMLALMGYIEKTDAVAVTILSLSLGFNGAATMTNLANHHDLAPNYAGTLYGIMNAIGTCTGFLFPAIVGYILQTGGNTLENWQLIFWIGSGLYLVSAIVFIIFGSGVTQDWNFKEGPTS